MQRRSLFCVFLLTTYCLLNAIAATSQVTDTTTHPVVDTVKPKSDTTHPVVDTVKPKSDSTHPVTDSLKAVTDTAHPLSVDPELIALGNQKNPPREYTIAGIKISGTKYLDESLLTSISGLTVGDKVTIPGGDNFSKAIMNLWKQRLFADIEIGRAHV